MYVKLQFLSSSNFLIMRYISTSFLKISQRLSELLSGHEIMTDGQTDGEGDYYIEPPPTSSGGALIWIFIFQIYVTK